MKHTNAEEPAKHPRESGSDLGLYSALRAALRDETNGLRFTATFEDDQWNVQVEGPVEQLLHDVIDQHQVLSVDRKVGLRPMDRIVQSAIGNNCPTRFREATIDARRSIVEAALAMTQESLRLQMAFQAGVLPQRRHERILLKGIQKFFRPNKEYIQHNGNLQIEILQLQTIERVLQEELKKLR